MLRIGNLSLSTKIIPSESFERYGFLQIFRNFGYIASFFTLPTQNLPDIN
jgi:hypothetical protein